MMVKSIELEEHYERSSCKLHDGILVEAVLQHLVHLKRMVVQS